MADQGDRFCAVCGKIIRDQYGFTLPYRKQRMVHPGPCLASWERSIHKIHDCRDHRAPDGRSCLACGADIQEGS